MTEESNHDDCDGCSFCCPPEEEDSDSQYGRIDQREHKKTLAKLDKMGFRYVGAGMFRTVFGREGVVVKVPHNKDGYIDNRTEAAAWRKYRARPTPFGLHLAPCRLLTNGCLMMMAVQTHFEVDELPDWAHNIDCGQVGMYKGRLVAYDYALDIMERVEWEKDWGTSSEFFHRNRLNFLRRRSIQNKVA